MPAFTGDPIELDQDGRNPWDRQTQETPKRYAQFCAYRDQGPTRTLTNTAETLTLSPVYMRHTSAHFRWRERVDAFDREQDRLFAVRMAADRRRTAQLHLGMGTALFNKIRERLPSLLGSSLSALEVARLAEVALKLQQSGLGLPDTTVAVIGDQTQPLAHEDVTGMSMDERRAMLDRVVAELQRRRGLPVADDHADEPEH